MTTRPNTKTGTESAAEMKYWQEWADKSPDIIRAAANQLQSDVKRASPMVNAGFIAVGAALGIATFTKMIRGKWKILSGIGAAGSLILGIVDAEGPIGNIAQQNRNYADKLAVNPVLRQEVAEYLASNVTAEDIQKNGIDAAVKSNLTALAMDKVDVNIDPTAKYLRKSPTIQAMHSR